MPAAAGAGYGINAKAKNKDLALKFVNFVMSPEGMNLFAEKQGGLPALPDTGYAVDPSLTELSTFINDDRTVPFMDQLWPNAKVQQTMLTRPPGDLQRPVHPGQAARVDGHRLQVRRLTSSRRGRRSGKADLYDRTGRWGRQHESACADAEIAVVVRHHRRLAHGC